MSAYQGVLNCGKQGRNGWSFPRRLDLMLRLEFEGLKVLQLFGGQAAWGVRLDTDTIVRPDVIGDAWLPPFARDSFEVVILDPPYTSMNSQEKNALGSQAAWIASKFVVWLHTLYIDFLPDCRLERYWFVIPGNQCLIRQLAFFAVRPEKRSPMKWVTRGPAMRYNRWRAQPHGLPFPAEEK